jgi:hypothetical protein
MMNCGAKLNGLSGEIELCDPEGQTIGYVVSASEYKRLLMAWAIP